MISRRAALESRRLERVSSWGGHRSGLGYVYRPETVADVGAVFEDARRAGVSVGLRGAGCSYGDASMNNEGITLDTSRFDRILEFDADRGVARIEPGVTIQKLWQHVLPHGYWPPVVPGTMFPTLGGCAAMNIHGKNNFRVGTVGDHLLSLTIALPNGELRRCSREQESDLFLAAIGGFGMLGVITELSIHLKRVSSGLLEVEPIPTANLEAMFQAFEAREATADYLVGWVDAFASGPAAGRGLVHAARYLSPGEDKAPVQTLLPSSQALPPRLFGALPTDQVWRLMQPFTNDPGMLFVNLVKYHQGRFAGPRKYRQSLAAFSFLLDYVPGWKRSYGAGGLIQYQSFIPKDRARATFDTQLETCRRRGLPPYLAVFKRHRPDPFLMTHAVDGYSLALDFKSARARWDGLRSLTEELDRLVLDAGGRFYFAKDSTLSTAARNALVAEERTQRFLALKSRVDPEMLLQTDLYRRVFGK